MRYKRLWAQWNARNSGPCEMLKKSEYDTNLETFSLLKSVGLLYAAWLLQIIMLRNVCHTVSKLVGGWIICQHAVYSRSWWVVLLYAMVIMWMCCCKFKFAKIFEFQCSFSLVLCLKGHIYLLTTCVGGSLDLSSEWIISQHAVYFRSWWVSLCSMQWS